jgi:hypothetical protein
MPVASARDELVEVRLAEALQVWTDPTVEVDTNRDMASRMVRSLSESGFRG